MEKEFVNYNQALKLKELGFDEPCMAVYFGNGEIEITLRMVELEHIPCPTYSQAFRWFREKYRIHSFIDCKWKNLGWEYELVDLNKMESISTIGNYGYNTPEESELECLKKLIELVENEKTL